MNNIKLVQVYFRAKFMYIKNSVIHHKRNYINIIFNRFGILNYNHSSTSINKGTKLQTNITQKLVDNKEYYRFVSILLYLLNIGRPNINFIISFISRYYTLPQMSH